MPDNAVVDSEGNMSITSDDLVSSPEFQNLMEKFNECFPIEENESD